MERPDHIEFDVKPVDITVLKDLAVGTLRAVREVFRMPREFASHGDHTFGKRPFEAPIEQPAPDWTQVETLPHTSVDVGTAPLAEHFEIDIPRE